MDIREIRYFVEVAKEKNITRAAKNLYLSQPALSRALKKVEDEYNVKLFSTMDRRTVLTEKGQEVFELSLELLAKYNSIIDVLQRDEKIPRGQISLSMPLINSQTQFMQMFLEFFEKYPGIRLNVYEKGDIETEEAVFEGEVDIGVVMKTSSRGRFDELVILKSEVAVLANEEKPYADKGFIHPVDLKDDVLFLQSDDYAFFNEVSTMFRKDNVTPNIGFTSARRELLVSLAQRCKGTVIMPLMILQTEAVEQMRMIPFYEPFPCGLKIIKRKNRELSPAAEILVEEIASYFSTIQNSCPEVVRPHLGNSARREITARPNETK